MFIKCPKCSENLVFGPDDVKTMSCIFNGSKYRVLYFDCIVCQTKIFVQVDDDISMQKLEQCKIFLRKIMKIKHRDQIPGKKLLDDFSKGRGDLQRYRNALNKKLTGKTLVNEETGEMYKDFKIS